MPERSSDGGINFVEGNPANAADFANDMRPVIGRMVSAGLAIVHTIAAARNTGNIPTLGGEWKPVQVARVLGRTRLR